MDTLAIVGLCADLTGLAALIYGLYMWRKERREAKAAKEAWLARNGGYKVRVVRGDKMLVERPVGPKQAEILLDDVSSLSVFLKGLASPFGWINIDLVSEEAGNCGLLRFDATSRTWIVDLDKNPPKPGAAKEAEARAAEVARQARILELLEKLGAKLLID